MRRFISLLWIMLCINCSAQIDSSFVQGTMFRINGLTIDRQNQDTLCFAIIEIFIREECIFVTKSDFNGQFRFDICSNRLSDTLIIKVTQANYFQEEFTIFIGQDFSIVLEMNRDELNSFTQEMKRNYDLELDMDYAYQLALLKNSNNLYRHCDGTIMRFNDLIDYNHNYDTWKLEWEYFAD